jgi:hypothetical protein
MPKAPIMLTDEIPAPPALLRLGIETLPAIIGACNERTRLRFIQFFTANIRNRNTRRAYARAVKQFFDWTRSNVSKSKALHHNYPPYYRTGSCSEPLARSMKSNGTLRQIYKLKVAT